MDKVAINNHKIDDIVKSKWTALSKVDDLTLSKGKIIKSIKWTRVLSPQKKMSLQSRQVYHYQLMISTKWTVVQIPKINKSIKLANSEDMVSFKRPTKTTVLK